MDTSQALTIVSSVPALATSNEDVQRAIIETIGQAANTAAAHSELVRYQSKRSNETLRRQRADIALFDQYLNTVAVRGGLLPAYITLHVAADNLASWQGVTHGLVQGFVSWQLSEGYATGSINVRLATVKVYCRLASSAGYITPGDYTLIKTVEGYRASEARHVDEKRAVTRRPHAKKSEPVEVPVQDVAIVLKSIDATTRKGRRDRLLIALLFELGLRCGEVASLDVASVNIDANTLVVNTLKSRKEHNQDTLEMKPATRACMIAYMSDVEPEQIPLFTSSLPTAEKTRIDTRTINHRVAILFRKAGVTRRVGPHDGRHHLATELARRGVGLQELKQVGRWATLDMPSRYIIAAQVANAGVDVPDYGL